MQRSKTLDILLVNQSAEEIKLATLSFREFFPDCHIEAVYGIEDLSHWATQAPWRLILLDEQVIEPHPTSILPEIRRLAPSATLILQSERRAPKAAMDALHAGADFLLYKKSPTFFTELMLYAKDVFEKQDTRSALEELHSRHTQLIESLTDVLYELDSKGRFIYLSPNVTTMLGYSPTELVGAPYSTVLAPDQLDRARHRFDDRRTGTRATQNIQIELTPKSPSHQRDLIRIKAEISAKGLYNAQRQHLGTLGLLRDISKQRDQEETIRRLTHQLAQTNQLTTTARHLANLSKDLESPQTSVLTQSQQLLNTIRDIRLIERVEALARYAEQAVRVGEAITNVAIDSDSQQQTINDLLDSVLSSYQPKLLDTNRINRVYTQDLPPFRGQRTATTRLLRMLLEQALRYTTVGPTHRCLRIRTSAVPPDSHELPPNTSSLPSPAPVELEIRIEETDQTVVGEGPWPHETGDLFEAYTLLKQVGGRLDFLAPSGGHLSITIRIPIEPVPLNPSLSPQHPVITETPPIALPIPASPLPERRGSQRVSVCYPARITIDDNTYTGTITRFGQGGLDVLVDALLPPPESQHAYVLLKTDDALVELEAIALNRGLELAQSRFQPGPSRFVLRVSGPIDDTQQHILSVLLQKAEARTLSMTIEVLLTPKTSQALRSDVTGKADPNTDHRETVRVRVKLPIHAHVLPAYAPPQHSLGTIINLSRGGACLQLDHIPGKVGDRVMFSLSEHGPLSPISSQLGQPRSILLSAVIVWMTEEQEPDATVSPELAMPHQAIGVCFTTPTPSDEQEIHHILAQHIISSMNTEHIPDHPPFIHASWECRNDKQQVIAITDTHLRYQISSNRPIVIIIPGYGQTQTDYLPLASYLATNQFRILRYDHTHHIGLSDGESVSTSLGHMQSDLQCLLLFARTTWPTVHITLLAEDVAARVALKTMALSCTADRLLLVDPVLDINAALFSSFGQDVVADYQRGIRRGITNLWGLNVNLDQFIGDAITGRYGDWQTAAADLAAVSPTPIIFTTQKHLCSTIGPGLLTQASFPFGTFPIIELSGTLSGQSALENTRRVDVFQSLLQQISSGLEETAPRNLSQAPPHLMISHRLLREKERIRIRHYETQANRDAPSMADLAQHPQLQHIAAYGMPPADLYQQLLPIEPGMTILEVGCEQSEFSKMLVANHTYTALYRGWTAGNPVHYIGLSQSQDALATPQHALHTFLKHFFASVSSELSASNFIRTTWLAKDWGTSLPFDDHSIDRILFPLSLPFTRSPLRCLREALRVLRPNGIIVATAFRPHTDLTSLVRHHLRTMNQDEFSPQAQSVLLLLGRLHKAIRHGIVHSYEPHDFESLCIQAGGQRLHILSVLDDQLLLALIQKSNLSS